jgi:RNA polymerase sigma factor for flagellar operon FliA
VSTGTGTGSSGRESGSEEERERVDALVQRYHALADQLTSMLLTRVPRSVDRGDLQSAAMFGLFQAATAWSPDRGVTFEAFARHRIRGALLDELRGRDWASRRVRSFARACAVGVDELTATLGRRPTDQEVATLLGVSVTAIEANERDLHVAALRSSDALTEDSCPLESSPEEDPQAILERREQFGYLHDAVALLPERLRRVVVGYYVDELPMQALATELGVTESRISQMRAEAVRLLKGALSGALDPDHVQDLAFGDHVSARALDMAEQLHATSDYRERLGLTLSA